jgi:hypothetical protein
LELRTLLVLVPTLLLQSLGEETLLLCVLSHGLRGRDRRQKFVSFDPICRPNHETNFHLVCKLG